MARRQGRCRRGRRSSARAGRSTRARRRSGRSSAPWPDPTVGTAPPPRCAAPASATSVPASRPRRQRTWPSSLGPKTKFGRIRLLGRPDAAHWPAFPGGESTAGASGAGRGAAAKRRVDAADDHLAPAATAAGGGAAVASGCAGVDARRQPRPRARPVPRARRRLRRRHYDDRAEAQAGAAWAAGGSCRAERAVRRARPDALRPGRV